MGASYIVALVFGAIIVIGLSYYIVMVSKKELEKILIENVIDDEDPDVEDPDEAYRQLRRHNTM